MRNFLAALTFTLVLGCTSAEEERRKVAEAHEARAEADNSECLSLGTQFGTPQYIDCRIALKQVREQRRANAIRALGLFKFPTVTVPAIQPQQRLRTHCYFMGDSMICY